MGRYAQYDDHDSQPRNGCSVSPGLHGCLKCPLPSCRYEDSEGYRAWLKAKTDQQLITAMQRDRLTVSTAAERFGVTKRTVYRTLARQKV